MFKKCKYIFFIVIMLSNISYAKELPIDKENYLFRNVSVEDIGMGYTSIANKILDGLTVNPASVYFLKNSYFTIGYSYAAPKNIYYYQSVNDIITKSDINYISLTSDKGGMYWKKYSDEKELSLKHKYNFNINEIGLSITQKSTTTKGLSSGLTLKIYEGGILEGRTDNGIDLTVDKGLGYGIDLGFLLKRNFVYAGVVWENILGKIYWKKYDDVLVNGRIRGGIGVNFGFVKYGLSFDKVLLDTVSIKYGQGIEMLVLNFPKEYSNFMLKGLTAKFRAGNYGENLFTNSKINTYGLEIGNNKYILNFGVASEKINPFEDQNMILKSSISYKLK
ncbi:hypothetical protein [Haliovirga abyssi]|uniref:DUF5723 domain-containing protein n=1 Tax=Haliovirga abyssi TaxID=2996794 RepID=A0AAU9DNP0_9FUSO|nr:hypothetical protein [Haliovirga abyssi]BDU49978.1 hypothetical protein HLVA_05470 [Haliovirga abyssi]